MSTNPFVCQPNLQKIGGFLPFVKAPVPDRSRLVVHPDSVFPAETSAGTL